jgi:hypothetical protein
MLLKKSGFREGLADDHPWGQLVPAKEMPLRRPYGTPLEICGILFPTLKRGANKRCASGAGARTFFMQW